MDELAQLMRLMNPKKKISKAKLIKEFEKLDRDGSGSLDKDEFFVWWKKRNGNTRRRAEQIGKLRELWDLHDSGAAHFCFSH